MAPKENKKMKTQQKEEEKHDLDRLGTLPNEILGHVLSFLDTKSAIQTSVLSKRYRHAWTSSPYLDFKFTRPFVLSSDDASLNDRFRLPLRIKTSFESDVIRVLQQRGHYHLTSFRLSLHLEVSSKLIGKCVDYAAQNNVQHLRIRGFTRFGDTIELPTKLFDSSSLVTLRLNNARARSLELPKSVSLPNLKGLHLKNFVFSERNYNGQVFSGCPSLENLVLIKCSIRPNDEVKMLEVNCSNLKSLEIRNWRSPWSCFDEHMINVNAPRLLFFKFQGFLARVDFRSVMPNLKEAYIDLSYPSQCSSDRMIRTSENLLTLLQQISNVEFISLLSKTYQAMSVDPESREATLSLFVNLEIVEGAERPMKNLKRLFWPPQC